MSTHRLLQMTDDELGAALGASDPAWPASPDLAQGVVGRIVRSAPDRRPRSARWVAMPRRRRLILLAAAIVLALATAAGAARLVWDLGAVVVRFEPSPSLPPITFTPDGLGAPVSPARAEELAGFAAPSSSALGPPDQTWADEVEGPGGVGRFITMAWAAGPQLPAIGDTAWGAVLIVFHGDVEIAAKAVPNTPFGHFEEIRRGAFTGYWIDAPHALTLLGEDGPQDTTVVGRVLLWEEEPGVVLRLETALPKGSAVLLARSIG